MYRVITIEREYGSGGGEIACELSKRLGWKLWDHALTEEIAKLAKVDCSAVERCEERVDGAFRRLAKIFLRGSYERNIDAASAPFDADRMVEVGQRVMEDAAREGNGVIVGRGAPYFLRQHPDTFHVFLYAPRSEKIRRLQESGRIPKNVNIEEMVNTVDRDRITFIKHYFGADWPTRSLYHLMVNTAIGNENVLSTILGTMRMLENKSGKTFTDFEEREVEVAK
ncbi:MAG: cytidylate kinase-like family protein [Acidobacteriaceae bacterium]